MQRPIRRGSLKAIRSDRKPSGAGRPFSAPWDVLPRLYRRRPPSPVGRALRRACNVLLCSAKEIALPPQLNDLKAEFGAAYVRAVAHAAGFFVQESQRLMDSDGVDLTIFSPGLRGVVRSPRLEVQVKATSGRLIGDPFPFKLSAKNYDELRSTDFQLPRILVVVSVPWEVSKWVSGSRRALHLRNCGYWKSLIGHPPSANQTQETTFVSKASLFNVVEMQGIMHRVAAGQLP
jgi:hypothetical protein